MNTVEGHEWRHGKFGEVCPILGFRSPSTESTEENSSTMSENTAWRQQESIGVGCTQGTDRGNPLNLPSSRKFSKKDLRRLTGLFTYQIRDDQDNSRNREEVARCGGFGLSRIEMGCLSACIPISSKVINTVAGHLCEIEPEIWCLPTYFGDIAKLYEDPSQVQGGIATTINLCRLQRFHRRLNQCSKIFIPLHDNPLNHWYLLVMNLVERKSEVWDCMPDSRSSDRRMADVGKVIAFTQHIFANEMTRSTNLYFNFPSFKMSVPKLNHTHDNNADSGVHVIRQMQHHGCNWYTHFDSLDHRYRIALEILNYPRNNVIHSKSAAASQARRPSAVTTGSCNGTQVMDQIREDCNDYHDSRALLAPTNGPTGRKWRSHRRRRSRA